MFGDDVVRSKTPCTKQLLDVFREHQPAGVIAVQEVPRSEVYRYGVPKLKESSTRYELEYIVEKPAPAYAPSNLAQLGRFVFTHPIIDILETLSLGKGGELWLTDAIDRLASSSVVLVHAIEGRWFTTGDPLRFLKTTVEMALDRPDIGSEFAAYLKELDLSHFEAKG
jgi:UTP--glucose-1-phosphate uridylyltransferase